MLNLLIGPIAQLAGTWLEGKVEKTKANAKAQVAEALKAPRTPPPPEDEDDETPAAATTDEVPFDPLAALIGSEGVALDGSAFEAAADQPMDDLDFDPRVSPHAYEAAPASVGIIIVDHGSKVAAANERLERLCEGYATTRAPKHWVVRPAHMELASPSIGGPSTRWWRRAAPQMCAIPSFCQGRHVREDVPALLDEAASRHNIPYHCAPLGEAPALLIVHDVVSGRKGRDARTGRRRLRFLSAPSPR